MYERGSDLGSERNGGRDDVRRRWLWIRGGESERDLIIMRVLVVVVERESRYQGTGKDSEKEIQEK